MKAFLSRFGNVLGLFVAWLTIYLVYGAFIGEHFLSIPALEQIAQEMQGKVKVVKLDVDQNPKVTGEYGIRAMPTLLLFKNGQVAAQHTGALVQKKKLEDWINTSVTATA